MALLDLLGRRWALRVLWSLHEDTLTFRELQASCDDMSPTVLNRRLSELREAGVVELTDDGYRLTRHGDELMDLVGPMSAWAKRWARRMDTCA